VARGIDMGGLDRAETAGKPAIVCGDRSETYAQLEARTNRLAHAFAGLGVEPLQRIAAMLPNGIEILEAGLAAAKAAAVVVPVNWHFKRDELAWVLSDSGAKVLVTHASLLDEVRPALERAPGCALVVVGAADDDARGGVRAYERVLADAPDTRPARVGFETPEFFFYTSGTTGRPRGVERDAPRPGAPSMSRALAAMWGFTENDVWLAASPLYHAAGAYAFTELHVGATVVVMERWDAREWLRLVDTHRVTATFMVPAHFIRVLEVPAGERARYDTSSLRLILHAAAPCPVAVKRAVLDAFPHVDVWEFYGASEGGATRISAAEWREHEGSVGRPWPGTEVIVLDPDGEPVPPGESGMIYVRSPHASRFRYHGDDAKTTQAWRGDAFTVGDIGYLDGDGYLYVTDRASDMVLRGGVNVYPAEIEQCLHGHPAVVDCAVFGVPDERMGEEVAAMVEVRAPVEPDELRAYCREHLASFKVPRDVTIVDALPRDALGKIAKRRLRDAARGTVRAD
jgi:long-chain acyl-CoA synthetase